MVARPTIAERLAAQGLSGSRPADPTIVVERLLAVQAQDPRGARLALRARTEGIAIADVDRALTEERSLVISWLNRGTLHLVRREDYPWLQALTTPPLQTANRRRLEQEGVTAAEAERGVEAIGRALGDEGPLTREELRERLREAKVPVEGQAMVQVLMLASLRGLIVRGPMAGRQHAFALVRDWLGESPKLDREACLAELARRFLAGHGPATDRDLARWAGLPLRDARAGLRAISAELEEEDAGLLRLSRAPRRRRMPPPRLLGAFDPVLLGWASREELVGEHGARIVAGGLFRPFALVGGRVVAGWRWDRRQVRLERFEGMSGRDEQALRREAADVTRFLGG